MHYHCNVADASSKGAMSGIQSKTVAIGHVLASKKKGS